jgi:sporulation protein YlmC with PRC-barrel domain
MEIPLNAQVECKDGVCGHSVFVIINPVTEEVTHVVVREDTSPNTEYVVPVNIMDDTVADTIQLSCSQADLKKMDPFILTKYIEEKVSATDFAYSKIYGPGSVYYIPYNVPDITVSSPVEIPQVPPGELAVNRGTRVEATDGYVGKVDEFVVNPENCHITHLVMREGHLWGKKDVVIPISAIDKTYEDVVYLNLSKKQIEALPCIPVKRLWD